MKPSSDGEKLLDVQRVEETAIQAEPVVFKVLKASVSDVNGRVL